MIKPKHTYAICKGEDCGNYRLIYHKGEGLCQYCNNKRLQAISIARKSGNTPDTPKASLISPQGKKMMAKDQQFYKELWEERPHYCEECLASGKGHKRSHLGHQLRNFFFSHILTKGAWPQLRLKKRNINILCFNHHQQWETGKRWEMAIYDDNQLLIIQLKSSLL